MSDRSKLARAREQRVRELRNQGMTVAAVAEQLGLSERLVLSYGSSGIAPGRRRHQRLSREEKVEAGMAYITRFGVSPSARNWHATKAFRDSPDTYRRYIEGWRKVDDDLAPDEVRPWPRPDEIGADWGSFSAYVAEVQRTLAELHRAGTPYKPAPLPKEHLAMAAAKAWSRSMPTGKRLHRVPPQFVSSVPDVHPPPETGLPPSVLLADGVPIKIGQPEDRRHVAVIGDPGSGKTSFLWRLALTDARAAPTPVFVLESSDGDIAPQLAHAEANLVVVNPRLSVERLSQLAQPERVVAVRDDDHARRRLFVAKVVVGLRMAVSLIVDDAEDLVPDLSKICRSPRSTAIVAAAWAMRPTSPHMSLFEVMPSVFIFKLADPQTDAWVRADLAWRYATGI